MERGEQRVLNEDPDLGTVSGPIEKEMAPFKIHMVQNYTLIFNSSVLIAICFISIPHAHHSQI